MALPKFDMSSHESNMSAEDVKSLDLRHGVPLDLHLVAITKGWAMDKLPDDMIGLYEQIEPINYVRVILSESIYCPLRELVPRFLQMVTMSEYLCFPFLSGATIEKGNALTNQDLREQHTAPPLPGKRKKASAARSDSSITSGHGSSPEPIRVANLDGPNMETPSGAAANIAESQENQSLYDSHHDSANHSGHEDQTIRNLTLVPTEVLMLMRVSGLEIKLITCQSGSFTEGAVWTTLCGLLEARKASQQSSRPYLEIFKRFKKLKNDHAGCTEQVQLLKGQNSELSPVNKDQALKIKELEDTLARKDSALIYAERINAERAQESEKLVTQLSKTKMEKFDCVHKLLPIVVARLLQSHDFRYPVSDLLKVYPDSPPSEQAPPSQPSSGKAASTSAPRAS
nr:hypothetical protein [Tanacetum cinerariifolium]